MRVPCVSLAPGRSSSLTSSLTHIVCKFYDLMLAPPDSLLEDLLPPIMGFNTKLAPYTKSVIQLAVVAALVYPSECAN